jgi:hypothetical protein
VTDGGTLCSGRQMHGRRVSNGSLAGLGWSVRSLPRTSPAACPSCGVFLPRAQGTHDHLAEGHSVCAESNRIAVNQVSAEMPGGLLRAPPVHRHSTPSLPRRGNSDQEWINRRRLLRGTEQLTDEPRTSLIKVRS